MNVTPAPEAAADRQPMNSRMAQILRCARACLRQVLNHAGITEQQRLTAIAKLEATDDVPQIMRWHGAVIKYTTTLYLPVAA